MMHISASQNRHQILTSMHQNINKMISTEQVTPQTSLKAPQLNANNFQSIVTKIEPYRQGGIRLEHQNINGKHIFHNYGHGNSGISLAYGSAFLSVRSLYTFVENDRPIECAVIGSGIIGLLTAIQLSKKGNIVTLYADKFPKYGQKQQQNKFGAQLNDGVWLPYGYDMSNKIKHELLSKISYDYYKDCYQKKKSMSFKVVDVYEKDSTIDEIKEKIPSFLYNNYKIQNVDLGNGIIEPYVKFRTIKINTERFLEELRVQAILRGVKMVERHFETQQQVLGIKENNIFNCMGFSSKKIFPDQKLQATLDHTLIFKNPSKLEYSLSACLDKNLKMRVHCSEDRIILKSEENKDYGDGFIKNLIHNTEMFFDARTLKAKL